MTKATQKIRFQSICFKLKTNTKQQSNRNFIKTIPAFLISKRQLLVKSTQITLQKSFKTVRVWIAYIKIRQIKYNRQKKPLLLERPKSKDFQSLDLEIDFLIDSGTVSNIINFPTWNEIQTLYPKWLPSKTASKLATAQGSCLTNYGQIQLNLVPTQTMEQKKLLNNSCKQTQEKAYKVNNFLK